MNDRFLIYTIDILFLSLELIARLERKFRTTEKLVGQMTPFQFCAFLMFTSLLYAGKMKLILIHTNACKDQLTLNTNTITI